MKNLLLISCLLFVNTVFSQEQKKNYKEGILTTITDESIAFKDLTWDKNGKAHYLNAKNKQMEQLYDNSIKEIEEVSGNDPKFLAITEEAAVVHNIPTIIKDDGLYKPDYPEGIYATKEEFINKKPSQKKDLTKKGLYGFDKPIAGDEESTCFFFDQNDSKLKNVFAVVYHGGLYFNIKAILNNRSKNDRAQDSDNPNSFVRVVTGGNNYLYTEANLANVWAKGLAYNAGVSGSVLAGTLNVGKGVVWDYKNQEFNIFKNCKDYNEFIKEKSPEDLQKCPNQQADILLVRKAIDKIK